MDGYVTGPPELVVEVARSSRRFDLGPKKADYERAGVLEYVFVGLDPDEIRWFVRARADSSRMPPGRTASTARGLPRPLARPRALFAGDLNRLIAALEQGLATPEHAAFVARLAPGA